MINIFLSGVQQALAMREYHVTNVNLMHELGKLWLVNAKNINKSGDLRNNCISLYFDKILTHGHWGRDVL